MGEHKGTETTPPLNQGEHTRSVSGNNTRQQTQARQVHPSTQPGGGTKGKGLGIAAMVLGIVAAVCAFIPLLNIISFPLVILGLVLGVVSLIMARGGKGPVGFGVAGIACSGAALIITLVMYGGLGLASSAINNANSSESGINAQGSEGTETSDTSSPGDVANSFLNILTPHEKVAVQSVAFDQEKSSSAAYYYRIVLENTSSETLAYVQVQLPLYDEAGVQVDTAFGNASNVTPGTFQIEAMSLKADGQVASYNESEIEISAW